MTHVHQSLTPTHQRDLVTTTKTTTTAPILRGAYSPEHAAAYLDISRSEVYRLMASGALRGYRHGRLRRFLRSELDAFLSRMAEAASDGGYDGGSAA